eukprot:m.74781 g.74781  ORF g.74781 m.74781 type:complete len:724 (+) comp12412_c0_seq1:338-2509(+)
MATAQRMSDFPSRVCVQQGSATAFQSPSTTWPSGDQLQTQTHYGSRPERAQHQPWCRALQQGSATVLQCQPTIWYQSRTEQPLQAFLQRQLKQQQQPLQQPESAPENTREVLEECLRVAREDMPLTNPMFHDAGQEITPCAVDNILSDDEDDDHGPTNTEHARLTEHDQEEQRIYEQPQMLHTQSFLSGLLSQVCRLLAQHLQHQSQLLLDSTDLADFLLSPLDREQTSQLDDVWERLQQLQAQSLTLRRYPGNVLFQLALLLLTKVEEVAFAPHVLLATAEGFQDQPRKEQTQIMCSLLAKTGNAIEGLMDLCTLCKQYFWLSTEVRDKLTRVLAQHLFKRAVDRDDVTGKTAYAMMLCIVDGTQQFSSLLLSEKNSHALIRGVERHYEKLRQQQGLHIMFVLDVQSQSVAQVTRGLFSYDLWKMLEEPLKHTVVTLSLIVVSASSLEVLEPRTIDASGVAIDEVLDFVTEEVRGRADAGTRDEEVAKYTQNMRATWCRVLDMSRATEDRAKAVVCVVDGDLFQHNAAAALQVNALQGLIENGCDLLMRCIHSSSASQRQDATPVFTSTYAQTDKVSFHVSNFARDNVHGLMSELGKESIMLRNVRRIRHDKRDQQLCNTARMQASSVHVDEPAKPNPVDESPASLIPVAENPAIPDRQDPAEGGDEAHPAAPASRSRSRSLVVVWRCVKKVLKKRRHSRGGHVAAEADEPHNALPSPLPKN